MDYTKILTLLLSAAGFWKFVEVIFKYGIEKKLKKAETGNYAAQANSLIVNNWVQWSQALEKKVTELEALANEMGITISQQREQISNLEKLNTELESQLKELKKG